MTTIADLARSIQDQYGIDSHGAALAVVGVYVDQIADDPDLWDAARNQLTADGEDVVRSAVEASHRQQLYGTVASQALEALAEKAVAAREMTAERDSLIRFLMTTEIPRKKIAEAGLVSEPRLYQIRDGR